MPSARRHLARFTTFRDLKEIRLHNVRNDVSAAIAVAFLSVPQGIAYALIAGLPPAMGLYAAAWPAIVGGLFRSSTHVVTGPTNALSLLVGTIVATQVSDDPIAMAATLAVLTGVIQVSAGVLKLGSVVDYISSAVVLGYITGAGVLIGVGQLKHATGTSGDGGTLAQQLVSWAAGLAHINPPTLLLSTATVATLLIFRKLDRRIPGAVFVMLLGIAVSWGFDLSAWGVMTVADINQVPSGLPPLTLPHWRQFPDLMTAAIACMVLSFVESSSVARAIASDTGQDLDMSAEFAGQGLANLAAGFSGSFVTSGSLTRSVLNQRAGASTRLSSVLSGLLMLAVLLFLGPLVDLTPIAVLAGLLLVVAAGLIDRKRIARTLSVTKSDAVAFLSTLLATWTLRLDHAILVGVGISVALFLRQVRLLTVRELSPDENGRLHEYPLDRAPGAKGSPIRFIHLEGALFFGSAGELRAALESMTADPRVKVLILRIKHAQGLDGSAAAVLVEHGRKMRSNGQHLLLVGVENAALALLQRAGILEVLDHDHLFPTSGKLFEAVSGAVHRAIELIDTPEVDDPLVRWAETSLEKIHG